MSARLTSVPPNLSLSMSFENKQRETDAERAQESIPVRTERVLHDLEQLAADYETLSDEQKEEARTLFSQITEQAGKLGR